MKPHDPASDRYPREISQAQIARRPCKKARGQLSVAPSVPIRQRMFHPETPIMHTIFEGMRDDAQ
jgi:hypothetical protein